jgi:large subunit ribosomal protein L10e
LLIEQSSKTSYAKYENLNNSVYKGYAKRCSKIPRIPKGQSYTRREYASRAPPIRVIRFTMGDKSTSYAYTVALIASHNVDIASNALESARITANKALSNAGKPYLFRICTYPHEIVREHKFMAFAGADRLSQGMRKAFGRPTGRSARVHTNQKILTVEINQDNIDIAKKALKRASKKLPIPCKIIIEEKSK